MYSPNLPTSRADTVNAFLAKLVTPVAHTETLALFDALDRVLAQDLVSPISVPPHDNSAMDGFAFDGAQLGSAPLSLKVVGTALAGPAWQGDVRTGECLKIMTGAVLPAGLDTVVPQELTQLTVDSGGEAVQIPPGVLQRGDNRRLRGEDLMQGEPAMKRGDRITPAALGLIARLGLAKVEVFRRLRVAWAPISKG